MYNTPKLTNRKSSIMIRIILLLISSTFSMYSCLEIIYYGIFSIENVIISIISGLLLVIIWGYEEIIDYSNSIEDKRKKELYSIELEEERIKYKQKKLEQEKEHELKMKENTEEFQYQEIELLKELGDYSYRR